MFYFCGANLPKPTIDPHFLELFEERIAVRVGKGKLFRQGDEEGAIPIPPQKKFLAMEEEPMWEDRESHWLRKAPFWRMEKRRRRRKLFKIRFPIHGIEERSGDEVKLLIPEAAAPIVHLGELWTPAVLGTLLCSYCLHWPGGKDFSRINY